MAKRFSKKKRIEVFSKLDGFCAYCGCEIYYETFHIDHISPKNRHLDPSKRGSDSIDNLFPSCKSCNSSKSNFSIEAWRNELELKFDRLIRDSSQFRILHRFGVIKKCGNVIFHFEKHGYGRK